MIKRQIILTLLILTILITACSNENQEKTTDNTLTVFAAASLTDAFTELAETFEAQHPGKSVSLNFAGSQQLAQQLDEGAPADLFASADMKQMQTAIDAGRINPDTTRGMVGNRLVIIFPPDNPGNIRQPLNLALPELDLLLAAEEVPAGNYSLEFLTKASDESVYGEGYKENVLSNVVSYEQNVRAVLNKILLGEADAGIVYTSDIYGLGPDDIGGINIPDPFNVSATYFIAPIEDSQQSELAEEFINFVLSAEGQDILSKYGFIPVL